MRKTNKKHLLFGCLLGIVLMASAAACGKQAEDEKKDTNQIETKREETVESTEETKATAIEFPYEMDEGRLILKSVFQSDIENPDAGNNIGENILSIEVQNNSGSTLVDSEISITMSDGTEAAFRISYLPADCSVWAFALDNVQTADMACIQTDVKTATYSEEDVWKTEAFAVEETGFTVLLTNNSGETKNNIRVYCHCKMDEICFGGSIYTYTVESLSAGETMIIIAEDCAMGEAMVVCIDCE